MEINAKLALVMKWALYAALAVMTAVMQKYVFSRLEIFGITPLLLGGLAVCIGMFEGAAAGAICGGLLGAFMYATNTGVELLYALVYSCGGFASGMLCAQLMGKKLAVAMLLSLAINAAACVLFFILIMWLPGRAGLFAMLRVGLPEIAYSTAVTPLVYLPVRLLAKASGSLEE